MHFKEPESAANRGVRPLPAARAVTGIQFVADLHDCHCAGDLLTSAGPLEQTCLEAVRACGLTPVGTRFHQFEPAGATGVVLLAESHLAVHTWPEHSFVSVDLYVCNFGEDNTQKAERLLVSLTRAFGAASPETQRIRRGGVRA